MLLTRALAVLGLSFILSLFAHAGTTKSARVDLLLQRESIHNVVVDDHKEVVYFERIGKRSEAEAAMPYSWSYSVDSALKQIYVAPMDGGSARPLFEQNDRTGYFFASADPWSPDRRYLAIYRFKEGRTQAGIYDVNRSSVRFFEVEARYEHGGSSLFWISNHELALVTDTFYVDGAASSSWLEPLVTTARNVSEARERGWRNGEVTAEVIGAGKYSQRSEPAEYDLVAIDVRTGKIDQRSLGMEPTISAPQTLSGKVIMREKVLGSRGDDGHERPRIERVLSVVDSTTGEKARVGTLGALRTNMRLWSASGRYGLTERVMEATDSQKAQRLYSIFDVATEAIVEHLPDGASDFAWVGDQLVYSLDEEQAPGPYADNNGGVAFRVDTPRPVAASADSFFYLEGGDLWRAGLGGARENLTRDYPHVLRTLGLSDRGLLSPTQPSNRYHTPALNEVWFSTVIEGRLLLIVFSADGHSINATPFPETQSQILVATERGAVFLTNAYETGSRLHYTPANEGADSRLLYHFNKHLAGVKPAVGPIRVDHKDFDGRDVAGWLYLPPGASIDQPKAYPLVVVSYPTMVYERAPINSLPYTKSIWDLHLNTSTPMEVFAAHGYAVLLPSVPLGERGGQGEPMTRIMPAVLSALDGAIETGFVNPDRMALAGQSGGGYGALSVAVQTDRFQAIVAMSSLSNFTSQYGQFPPFARINGNSFGQPGGASTSFFERGYGRMGATPWGDPDRYIRNSPFFHVDKVTTPIMLIHGDLDTATLLTQSEEMFTGLYREGKDAMFVKYFGEQHTIDQPQNQRDMWRRIFYFLEDNGVMPGPKTFH